MRIRLLIIILLLWLVEIDVFQLPQLHKHFNVGGKAKGFLNEKIYLGFMADNNFSNYGVIC
jgi:hypothetical protein